MNTVDEDTVEAGIDQGQQVGDRSLELHVAEPSPKTDFALEPHIAFADLRHFSNSRRSPSDEAVLMSYAL